MNPASTALPTPTDVYPIRILLKTTAPVRGLHALHSAVLYGLLAEAHAAGTGEKAGIPDGVLLDAPEQGRLHLRSGESYAFGLNLLSNHSSHAARRLDDLRRGLREISF